MFLSSVRRAPLRASASLCALLCACPVLAAETAADAEMPEVVITTDKERADGPVGGYRAKRSASATKTDTALIDIPQTVSVVPKEVLEDLNASTADKALDFVAGTAKGNTFGGLNSYDSIMRGFRTSVSARNGFTAGRRYDASTDAANVERVEVLMGPSAQIYGRSDPGGMYNIVTKKPLAENFVEGKVEAGSFNKYRGTIDANYVLSPDKAVLGRVNAAIEDKDSFRDHVDSQRQLLAPTLSWDNGGKTRATAEFEYLHDERVFDRGIVAVNGAVDALPTNRFLGEPDDNRIEMDNLMGSLRLEHDLDNDWTLRGLFMAKNGSMYGYATEVTAVNSATGIATRRTNLRDYYWTAGATQLEAVGRFAAAGMNHTLLSGMEFETNRSTERFYRGNATSINIWAPATGTARPTLTSSSNIYDNTNKYALYVQDQMDLSPQWQVQLGLRWDAFDQDFNQRATTTGKMGQHDDAFSPRAGLLYKPASNISTYANISKSFNKNPDASFTVDAAGKMLAPETGLGSEIGGKVDLFDERLSINAAAYRIVKKNVVSADPNDSTVGKASGKVESKGFDINITGNITPEWRLIGGYAYVDASMLQDSAVVRGSNLQNIPMHTIPLFSIYEFQSGPLAGLGLGGGVTYVGKRAVSDGSSIYLPEYAKVDLVSYYKLSDTTKFSFNIYNLFDTQYYSSALGENRIMPGDPFTALASVSMKF